MRQIIANVGGKPSVVLNKVPRSALQNAASIASLILTTDAMVAELPKDDARPETAGELKCSLVGMRICTGSYAQTIERSESWMSPSA